MTKPHAPVFAPTLERPGHSYRWLLAGSALALAACTSTPLPEWRPVSSTKPSTTAQARTEPARTAPVETVRVTPVAPNTALEALPYSAAIADLFPEPQDRYSTPGLSEGRRSFTTNSELGELLRNISLQSPNSSPRLGVLASGNAQSGAPIYALVAAKAPAITPIALDETGRPTVMIVAGQQGTDVAATEAVLVLAKELGTGGLLEPLLDQINIIFVPRANPDGFAQGSATTADGTDLRFDHLLLRTPEARFLAKLARDYRPSLLLDAGEFTAIGTTRERFNAVRANDMGLQYATTSNSHEFVNKAAREWLFTPVNQALQRTGQRVDWVFEPTGDSAASGFAMGTIEPTSLRNASSLKNVASLEASSRGSDLGRTHIQRRVHSHVQAMTTALSSAAERAPNLRQVQSFVTRDIASRACTGTLAVQTIPPVQQRNIVLVDVPTAQLVQKSAAWSNSLEAASTRTRNHACGYWLSADAAPTVERLAMLGVNVQRVAEPATLDAELYQASNNNPGTDAIHLSRSALQAAPGSYYISMNQPLAFLAAAALEPDTPYSYYSHGVLGNLNAVARVIAAPQIVFEED